MAAMPVGGVDGTLGKRLKGTPAEGRVHAKTGSLSGVRGLSGYIESAGGEWFVFSILANNFASPTTGADVEHVMDEAMIRLAEFPSIVARAAARRLSASESRPPACASSRRPPPFPPKRAIKDATRAFASKAELKFGPTTVGESVNAVSVVGPNFSSASSATVPLEATTSAGRAAEKSTTSGPSAEAACARSFESGGIAIDHAYDHVEACNLFGRRRQP